jgi:hypothetical protein
VRHVVLQDAMFAGAHHQCAARTLDRQLGAGLIKTWLD